MPNYSGGSSGPSDTGGGKYNGGGGSFQDSTIAFNAWGNPGLGIWGRLASPFGQAFSQPPASSYTGMPEFNDYHGTNNAGRYDGMNMGGEPVRQIAPPENPMFSRARQQAQNDMRYNGWGQDYQAPRMNPIGQTGMLPPLNTPRREMMQQQQQGMMAQLMSQMGSRPQMMGLMGRLFGQMGGMPMGYGGGFGSGQRGGASPRGNYTGGGK